jgi:flagellar biosynthetic protein FlhB
MPERRNQDKTEPATPKKLEDARKRGQVAVSREVPSVFILFMTLGVFFFLGGQMFQDLSDLMQGLLQNSIAVELHETSATELLSSVLGKVFWMLFPLTIAVLVAGIAANISQFGILFTVKPLVPRFSKMSPIRGLKRLFSLRSVVEVTKALFKILIIGVLAYATVQKHVARLPDLMQMAVLDILKFTGQVSLEICFYTFLALMVLAGLDYAYQRWQYENDLKMTKQEVKEELKHREGDPTVKARIKRAQIEISQRRMMADVPTADVVVTNPTHLAIALKFDTQAMDAPQVVAKGAGYIAARIKEVADASGVPVIEQKPLAQVLFKTVDIGELIPVSLYKAVAEVLAYVYRLKGMGRVQDVQG